MRRTSFSIADPRPQIARTNSTKRSIAFVKVATTPLSPPLGGVAPHLLIISFDKSAIGAHISQEQRTKQKQLL